MNYEDIYNLRKQFAKNQKKIDKIETTKEERKTLIEINNDILKQITRLEIGEETIQDIERHIKNYIDISLQEEKEEIEKIVKYNQINNNIFILKADNNLVMFENIKYLLSHNYKYYSDSEYIYFYYNKENE